MEAGRKYQERGASVNKKYEKIYFSCERLSASSIAAGKPLPPEKYIVA
jgi:hypothetical protein